MKQFVIDGEQFSNLAEFYDSVGTVLCPGFDWGKNLDAFNDILRGGFGAFAFGEPIQIVWLASDKSLKDLCSKVPGHRQTQFEMLVEIIQENDHQLIFK